MSSTCRHSAPQHTSQHSAPQHMPEVMCITRLKELGWPWGAQQGWHGQVAALSHALVHSGQAGAGLDGMLRCDEQHAAPTPCCSLPYCAPSCLITGATLSQRTPAAPVWHSPQHCGHAPRTALVEEAMVARSRSSAPELDPPTCACSAEHAQGRAGSGAAGGRRTKTPHAHASVWLAPNTLHFSVVCLLGCVCRRRVVRQRWVRHTGRPCGGPRVNEVDGAQGAACVCGSAVPVTHTPCLASLTCSPMCPSPDPASSCTRSLAAPRVELRRLNSYSPTHQGIRTQRPHSNA